MADPLATFVDALPKVELHLHLEGAVRPETLLALARRHGTTALPRTLDGLRDFYRFRDFAHFIDVYYAICENLVEADDFALIVRELGDTLAGQGVRYSEVTVTPFNHTRRGVPADELFAGLEQGRADVAAATGVRLAWCSDVPGEFGPDAADATVTMVLDARRRGLFDGVVSFGLGGPEVGVPRTPFGPAFARARDAGLHSVPHAGETSGPRSIWEALNDLGAERVGHGVRCLEDPALVAHLVEHAIPLEVCPTSNVCTGVVPELAAHPLRRLLDACLVVTLASDDPPMFNTTLRGEYLAGHRVLGCSAAELADIARAGVRAAFLPPDEQAALLDAIDAVPLPSGDVRDRDVEV